MSLDNAEIAPLIGIDGSSVVGLRTGIGHATANLLSALGRIWPEEWPPARLWVNSPRHELPPEDSWRQSPAFNIRRTRMPGRALLRGWQYLGWPPMERMMGPVSLVHSPASYIPPVQNALRVVTVHDLYFKYAPQDVETYGGRYFLQTFPLGLQRVDHIISVSRFTRDELVKFYGLDPGRITVIHLGVDRERFHPESGPEDDEALARLDIEPPYLLCVATLEPRKNLLTMIEGYARMTQILRAARQRPPRLVITGQPGWRVESLRQAVEGADLRDLVRLTGYLPDRVLPSLYRKAYALIFPSIYEGFGMPVLEAMACGCPVLMANAGALPEVGEDCAGYFNPRSSDSISRSLSGFLVDPHQRAHMRAAGLNHVKKFDWINTARGTLDVYRRVLANASAGAPLAAASGMK